MVGRDLSLDMMVLRLMARALSLVGRVLKVTCKALRCVEIVLRLDMIAITRSGGSRNWLEMPRYRVGVY